jgi:hypothetical protein
MFPNITCFSSDLPEIGDVCPTGPKGVVGTVAGVISVAGVALAAGFALAFACDVFEALVGCAL